MDTAQFYGSRSLVDLWVYAQGKSNVPEQFHQAAFIAMVASCLQDRVWMEVIADKPLFANLYVLLYGTSGCGKGVSITAVHDMAYDDPVLKEICNPKAVRITAQGLTDFLGKQDYVRSKEEGKPVWVHPRVWLCMEELAKEVGTGQRADDFIKFLTGMFWCGRVAGDITRTYGDVQLEKPVINFLGGSTPDWYAQVIRRDAIYGGFQPRLLTIKGSRNYSPDQRYTKPVYPIDRKIVIEHIRKRLHALALLPLNAAGGMMARSGSGRFIVHESVEEVIESQERNRPAPKDDIEEAHWCIELALKRKLAMIFSVCETPELVVYPNHWHQACQMYKTARATVSQVLHVAVRGTTVDPLSAMAKFIMKRGAVKHSELLVHMGARGVDLVAVKLMRQQLAEMGRLAFARLDKDDNALIPVPLEHVDMVKRGLIYIWTQSQEREAEEDGLLNLMDMRTKEARMTISRRNRGAGGGVVYNTDEKGEDYEDQRK